MGRSALPTKDVLEKIVMYRDNLIKRSMQSQIDHLEDFITDNAPAVDNESLPGNNLNGMGYL